MEGVSGSDSNNLTDLKTNFNEVFSHAQRAFQTSPARSIMHDFDISSTIVLHSL